MFQPKFRWDSSVWGAICSSRQTLQKKFFIEFVCSKICYYGNTFKWIFSYFLVDPSKQPCMENSSQKIDLMLTLLPLWVDLTVYYIFCLFRCCHSNKNKSEMKWALVNWCWLVEKNWQRWSTVIYVHSIMIWRFENSFELGEK